MFAQHKRPSEHARPTSTVDVSLRVIADCERLKAVILATRLSDDAAGLQALLTNGGGYNSMSQPFAIMTPNSGRACDWAAS
jgi:hypothetical protein